MNRLIALLFLLIAICPVLAPAEPPAPTITEAQSAYPPDYARLLAKYVTAEGVDYAAWHADSTDLRTLSRIVRFYATTSAPADRPASLAWHLNAYNSWILHRILEKYPTKGPLVGDTDFFHADKIEVAGKKLSLDSLEQKGIRSVFAEPRVHFALNCASVSCPPLQARPFDSDTLDADLEGLASDFINGPGVAYDASANKASISMIFDWYAEDFGGKSRIVAYLNQYRKHPIPTDASVGFAPYAWDLNAK